MYIVHVHCIHVQVHVHIHVHCILVSPPPPPSPPSPLPVDPVVNLIQRQLNSSGGRMVGMATQEDFTDAIRENDSDNRIAGCFLDGAGTVHVLYTCSGQG